MDKRKELKYLFLIIIVFIAACIETDIYLPAFPDMMAWFNTTEGAIQNLLTWNFIGICVAGPFYGPISDAIGRKKPLFIALGLFLAGSIMTTFAQNMDQMLWGRILQGLGSGGCFTLGTAIIFDSFQQERAISALNKLNMIVPLIMAGAPMVGGYLNQSFGFRSNFLIIAIFVLISLLVCIFFFGETLPQEKRVPFRTKSIIADFKLALSSVPFWQMIIATSLPFAGYIAFLSGTSVLFVVEFGMSKALFPLIQGAMLGGWVLGSLILNRNIAKRGIPAIKKAGIRFSVLGVLILAVFTLLTPQNPYLLTLGMVIYAFGANWIIGLYFPEGMQILPNIKGITASVLTCARLLIATIVIGFTSSCYNGTIYPMSAVVVLSVIAILPTLICYEKKRSQTALQTANPTSET